MTQHKVSRQMNITKQLSNKLITIDTLILRRVVLHMFINDIEYKLAPRFLINFRVRFGPFGFIMSQLRVHTLLGDSNIRGYINKTSCRANPAISAAQLISCGHLENLPDSLKSVRVESNVCLVSCLTGLIASSEGPSVISQRVQPLLQDVRDALQAECELNPTREYFIAPPMYRTNPIWYREGLPEILTLFSQTLTKNVPQNLRALPSFATPEYQTDGVNLTSYSGLEYVLHLFDSAQDLIERPKDLGLVSARTCEATRVLEDRVTVLEQDHRRLNQVMDHKIAIDAELSDFRQNERFEDSFVIYGLPLIPDELVGKDWQRRAVSDVQKVIKQLMGSEKPILFIQNSTKRHVGAEVTYTVKMVEVSDSKAIRRKFGSFFFGGRVQKPEAFSDISIKNRLTPETHTRISVMKLLAKRYRDANPGSKVQVIGYDARPMMKITPPSSASDRRVKSYNYIQAVTKLPINFPTSDFDPILGRINPELAGRIRSLFIVLSDDAFKKILRSRKAAEKGPGSGSSRSSRSASSHSVSSSRSVSISEASVVGAAEAADLQSTSDPGGSGRTSQKRGPTSPPEGSAAKK